MKVSLTICVITFIMLVSMSISTQSVFATKLFVNNADTVWTQALSSPSVSTQTKPSFIKRLFIKNADAVFKTDLVAPASTAEERIVEPMVPSTQPADIDLEIPETNMSNLDGIAVVVGNREYDHFDDVKFADNDARIMKEYLLKTLGYRENNIIYVENATKANLEELFDTAGNYQGKVWKWVREELSDVFVYYSGHGMPSPETEGGYLVPVDCSPENIGLSGYPMSTFYANLNQIKFRSCLVVLEACFSGMTPEGSLLKRISGGAGTINSQYPMFDSEKSPLGENGTIFASATGNQVSNWYTEKGHGMFTYFFLKGLSGEADIDHNGEITVS